MNSSRLGIPLNGHSMWPTIKDKEILEIELFTQPKPLSQLSIGQVVLAKEEEEFVAHRVVLWQKRKALKGDFANAINTDSTTPVFGQLDSAKANWVNRMRAQVSVKTLSPSKIKRFTAKTILLGLSLF